MEKTNPTKDNVQKSQQTNPISSNKRIIDDKLNEPAAKKEKEEKKEEKLNQINKKVEEPISETTNNPTQENMKIEEKAKPQLNQTQNDVPIERDSEARKLEEKSTSDPKAPKMDKKTEIVGPKPVDNVPDITEQGDWIATKKLKNKKSHNKRAGSKKDNIEPAEDVSTDLPVKEPVKLEPELVVSSISTEVPESKVDKSESKHPMTQQESSTIDQFQTQTLQSKSIENHEADKKSKPQQKKKTIAAWNVDDTKQSSVSQQEIKNESSLEEFPTLGGALKPTPKQTKTLPVEVSKQDDTPQSKQEKTSFYKVEEKEKDFPSLGQATIKPNSQLKTTKTNPSSEIKAPIKQQNPIKQDTKKTNSNWTSQSSKDSKNSGAPAPKYLEDFPSL